MAQSFLNRSELKLGLRNNNPGNLRPTGDLWQGQIGVNQNFMVFEDVAWGIRAFIKNIYSSVTKHKTDTLRKYIYRYAPPSENNTEAYLDFVVQQTGIQPEDPMPRDMDGMKKLMKAQFVKEIGWDNAAMLNEGDYDEAFSRLDSPVLSFFQASAIYYQANKTKVNILLIVAIALGVTGYVIYVKKRI